MPRLRGVHGKLFLPRVRKRPSTLAGHKNPAQPEAEDDSKIKDRSEALLFAETLQGTLSPNANPGKGSIGGLLNLMPKATARIQQAAQTRVHLSSTQSLYQTLERCARGESKKLRGGAQADLRNAGGCLVWRGRPAREKLSMRLKNSGSVSGHRFSDPEFFGDREPGGTLGEPGDRRDVPQFPGGVGWVPQVN